MFTNKLYALCWKFKLQDVELAVHVVVLPLDVLDPLVLISELQERRHSHRHLEGLNKAVSLN